MAEVALDPAYRRISVEEFLAMDLGDAKAELVDGLIYMMAGGTELHSRIAVNVILTIGPMLRGSGRRPYGSDLGARTGERTIRLPDVAIYCDNPASDENAQKLLLGDPRVVFEVLSPSTSALDQKTKLNEYRDLAGVSEIALIDPSTQRIRLVERTGVDAWNDHWLQPGEDLHLASLALTIPHSEIFASG